MSLIFPNGSRTVTTGQGGRPMDFSQPFNQQPGQKKSPAQRPASQQPAAPQAPALDMSAYAPGRARPVQPQSQGTPFQASQDYNENANERLPGNFGQPALGGDMQFAGGTPYFDERTGQARQPPFTQSAIGVGGQVFSDPSQAFAQRDALIQRINEARAPRFANSGIHATPPPQQPPLDFNALLAQANNMVANGWQNPLAAPQQAPPAYYPGFDPQTQNQFGQSMFNTEYGPSGLPPGVSSLPWQNDPTTPLADGLEWQRVNVGSRSEGWVPQRVQNAAGPSMQAHPFPAGPAFSPQPAPGFGFNEGYGFGGPSLPQPGYGTPPERRGMGRTADWRDRDGDGVDDRDQDGPGMPEYGRTTQRPGGKGRDMSPSYFPTGSDEWHQEMSARGKAAEAAQRPVYTPSREERGSVVDYKRGMTLAQQREAEAARRTSPPPARRLAPLPSNPRAAADAVRASGGSRAEGNKAWREAHNARINSQENRSWLASQSPANRRAYQMMQQYG